MNSELSAATVVIDNGSHTLKLGLAGEEAPRTAVPSIIGHSRAPELETALDKPDYCVGEKALRRRGLLNLQRPLRDRRIVDFEGMEKLWHHTFYEVLQAEPTRHACLLAVNASYTPSDREKCAEIIFEAMGCPALYLGDQTVLGLYAAGYTKGVALDCGHGGTHIAPVYEGYVSPYKRGHSPVAGERITHRLQQLLVARGLTFSSIRDEQTVQAIKEHQCRISLDFASETREFTERLRSKQVDYTLPDGQRISLGDELISAAEVLFSPEEGESGLAELVGNCHAAEENDMHRSLFENIVVFGGSTLLPNFTERLCSALKELPVPPGNFSIVAPVAREFAPWFGGSVFASLAPLASMWVGRKEYEEQGPRILREKFF